MSSLQAPAGQGARPGDAGRPRKLSKLAQDALDVVRQAAKRGRADMTLVEILHALRAQAPDWTIEKSSLSRELTHLALDGLLLRRPSKRKSAWEALPAGMDQKDSPASFAYYVPEASRLVASSAASFSAAAGAVVPVGQGAASEPDFY